MVPYLLSFGDNMEGEFGGRWGALWIFVLSYSAGRCFSRCSKREGSHCKAHHVSQCLTLTHGQILRKIHRSQEIPRECSHFTLC